MVSYCMHTPVFTLELKKRVYTGILNVAANQLLTVILVITYTFGHFRYILRA